MSKPIRYIVEAVASLVLSAVCFFVTRSGLPLLVEMVFFIAALILLLVFFRAIISLRKASSHKKTSDSFYNIWMLVVILVFSFIFYYASDITAYDLFSNEIELTVALILISFAIIVYCGVVLFKPLRLYGNAFYTACYTAALAMISAILYLFGDVLPSNSILDALRLFATLSSLALALSLALLEYDKKKALVSPSSDD